MNTTKLALDVVNDLRQLADSIETLANALTTSAAVPAQPAPVTPAPAIPIEKVRAVLAEKSQSGKQPEVRALISKFGAAKLTDIDPAKFADLLQDAEAL